MTAKCIYNTGEVLLRYERRPLGTSKETRYGELEIGKEYLVMGMILKSGYLTYLIDDTGIISACPSPLFEVVDTWLPADWYFKAFRKDSDQFLNKEAIWGYYELVYDDAHYAKLIEFEEEAQRIYYQRKIALEKSVLLLK